MTDIRSMVEDLLQPIREDAAVGDDARYDPAHEQVRGEVAKLESPAAGDVDWRAVCDVGEAFLRETSKDLVIAAHVGFALGRRDGLAGYAKGTALLAELLGAFGGDLYPARARARRNALGWFVDRMEVPLSEMEVGADDAASLEALGTAVRRLNETAGEVLGDDAPSLRPLREAIQRLELSLPAPEPEPAPEPAAKAAEAPAEPPAPSAAPVPEPASAPEPAPTPEPERAAPAPEAVAPPVDAAGTATFLRRTGSALVEAANALTSAQPEDPKGWRLWMTGLYLPLQGAPPATDGEKTALSAPPAMVSQQLERLAADQAWDELRERARGALEKARLCLDFQHLLHRALEGSGPRFREAAATHRRALAELLERAPDLVERSFQDGTPFASAGTRKWLSGLSGGRSAAVAVTTPTADAGDDETTALLARATTGDSEALQALQILVATAPHARARFERRLALAEGCAAAGAQSVAIALFADLLAEGEKRALEDWEPALWSRLLLSYHAAVVESANGTQPAGHSSDDLFERLCRTDPALAMQAAGR